MSRWCNAKLKTSFIIMVCNYDPTHVILLNAKYDPKYREEICEFLDLINEAKDIPPEDLKYPLSRMAAEGLTRF